MAYIPGHGTPCVLLFGRNWAPLGATVRAVLGKRGEPATPEKAEQGEVWSAIRDRFDDVGFENDFVSVADVSREKTLSKHPWPLRGGGAAALKELIESRGSGTLRSLVDDIGFASFTALDDVFIQPKGALKRHAVPSSMIRPMVIGESIRDWAGQVGSPRA